MDTHTTIIRILAAIILVETLLLANAYYPTVKGVARDTASRVFTPDNSVRPSATATPEQISESQRKFQEFLDQMTPEERAVYLQ